jgi:hypothetical protein
MLKSFIVRLIVTPLMVRWSFVVAPVITLLLYWFKLPLLIVIRLFKVIVSARGEAALAASSCS